jgi:hypothetical protein
MRRGSRPGLIYDESRPSTWPKDEVKPEGDKGLLLGINLSSDFCAEHEWGIRRLKETFGIPEGISIYGLPARRITVVPSGLRWVEFNSTYFMSKRDVENGRAEKVGDKKLSNAGFVYHAWYGEEPERLVKNTELHGHGLRTAWSEGDLAAVSSDIDDIEALRAIFAELEKPNAVLTFGEKRPFDNPGLVIAIADRLPAEVLDMWYNYDKAYHELRQEVAATHIEDLLKSAGKRYYALSPRRQEDGSIKFWLNPQEQQANNFGWFTLQDLTDWAKGTGPIPITKTDAKVSA